MGCAEILTIAEAVGDLAEHDAGTQGALGGVNEVYRQRLSEARAVLQFAKEKVDEGLTGTEIGGLRRSPKTRL